MSAASAKAKSEPAVALPTSSVKAAALECSSAMHPLFAAATNDAELPAAPLPLIPLLTPHGLAPSREGLSTPVVGIPKIVTEYPMPGARETHEMAVVGDNMLVISQQTDSTLVKVQLDTSTGRPLSCARFLVGGYWAGLHGLTSSQAYEGHVWATLQFSSLLVRINVGTDWASYPTVEDQISLPPSVNGPHCICEIGEDLWTSCKDSNHVVRISYTDHTDYTVYPCSSRPIFLALHPTSKDIYATLDQSSKIWRLDVASDGETTEIDIPATKGNTPVGLVPGPDGNVWFTLLGDAAGGTGTFARILENGEIEWFSLTTTLGIKAGLIHLAFDWDYGLKLQQAEKNRTVGRSSSVNVQLWLLASSLVAVEGKGIDAVFAIVVDCDRRRITNQHSIVLPTQLSATHRVLRHRTGLFVTELGVSTLAHITGSAVLKPADVVGETTDFYGNFGIGQSLSEYEFSEELETRKTLLNPILRVALVNLKLPALVEGLSVLELTLFGKHLAREP